MTETLSPHPTITDLWLTSDGRVFRELTASTDGGGYAQIRNGTIRGRRHNFVCETFCGPKPFPKAVVRHKNGRPNDDRAANLVWGSQADNCRDSIRHDRTTSGERNAQAKLTYREVEEIQMRRLAGEKGRWLAEEYGVTEATICDIHRNRTWKHV